MLILGLTGSIGMGKTTAAGDFRRFGVPVHDADAAVHQLMSFGGAAVPLISGAFPGVEVEGRIDRAKLGARVFNNLDQLRRLEEIIHPIVAAHKYQFIKTASRRRAPFVVLDVPLLFVLELEYGGLFTVNVEDEVRGAVLLIECPRILFPFARNILADVSRDGGFPPLMLGPLDFAGMYQQQLASQAEANKNDPD